MTMQEVKLCRIKVPSQNELKPNNLDWPPAPSTSLLVLRGFPTELTVKFSIHTSREKEESQGGRNEHPGKGRGCDQLFCWQCSPKILVKTRLSHNV